MDVDSFKVYIKTEGIYSEIAKDVETRYQNYKLDRSLEIINQIDHCLNGKNKKVIVNKKEFATLRAKTYSNLTDNNKKKKSHNHKKLCCKKKI